MSLSSREYFLVDEGGSWLGRTARRLYYDFEEVHYAANVYFLDYDFLSQVELLRGFFGWEASRGSMLAVSLFLAFLFWLLFRRFQGSGRAHARAPSDIHRKHYLRVVEKLRGRGAPIGDTLGPEEILDRSLPLLDGGDVDKLREITRRYVRLRYGRKTGTFRELRSWQRIFETVSLLRTEVGITLVVLSANSPTRRPINFSLDTSATPFSVLIASRGQKHEPISSSTAYGGVEG